MKAMLFCFSLSIQMCGDRVQVESEIEGGSIDDEAKMIALSLDGSTVVIGANQNDGNGSDSGYVRIFVNDAPTLTGVGRTLFFIGNDEARAIGDSLAETDVDDAKLESVTISIYSSNVSSEDVLGFTSLRLHLSLLSEHRKICPESKAVN